MEENLKDYYRQYRELQGLASRAGFFQYYFKELGRQKDGQPVHRTNVEAFNYVNDLHFEHLGEYKYSSYNSFRQQLAAENKNRRK